MTEAAPGIFSTTGQMNVAGRVRFDGLVTDIRRTNWSGEGNLPFDFRGLPSAGIEETLFFFLVPRPRAEPGQVSSTLISDDIDIASSSQLADFGPVAVGADPTGLRLNRRAVVRTATLTLEEGGPEAPGHWRGSLSGVLRSATAFDRARSCPNDRPLYDPDSGSCVTVSLDVATFFLGCSFGQPDLRNRGQLIFVWRPWWAVDVETGAGGECVSVRTEEEIRIRALVDSTTLSSSLPWILEVRLPRFQAVENVALPVSGDSASMALLWQTREPEARVPLLEADLGPPDRSFVGFVRIDDIQEGADGRFMAWMRGQVVDVSPP
jgi:hypothetical protein